MRYSHELRWKISTCLNSILYSSLFYTCHRTLSLHISCDIPMKYWEFLPFWILFHTLHFSMHIITYYRYMFCWSYQHELHSWHLLCYISFPVFVVVFHNVRWTIIIKAKAMFWSVFKCFCFCDSCTHFMTFTLKSWDNFSVRKCPLARFNGQF